MTAILQATGLHAYYGASHVLRGVDLSVMPGQAVGLMGRNGMGKTTLIRTLLGLVPARAGQVLVDGHDMAGRPPHMRARQGIAVVPEGRGVFASLSVRENLLLAARPGADGATRWPLDRVLAVFPPAGAAHRPPRRTAFGRRAADGRDWPGADDQPAAADPGRGDRAGATHEILCRFGTGFVGYPARSLSM